jgi:hypothetical protein
VREGYSDGDIFNADETGIFFRLTSDRTLKLNVLVGSYRKTELLFLCVLILMERKRENCLLLGNQKVLDVSRM